MTTAKKPKFSRVLLKLSGESLGDKNGIGISPEAVQHIAGQIREVRQVGGQVDGIYDSDPKKNPKAKRFAQITYLDALQRQLKVMDSTAFSLCMDNKMPIIVFDFNKAHNLRRVVMGEKVGTLVS